jgi:hypothetical protein
MSGLARHAWVGLLLLLIGCSGEVKLVPVEGTVTYAGQPLPAGVIVFCPDTDRGNEGPLAQAAIGPDGRFVLQTEGKPGAVPGWHRITLSSPPLPQLGVASLPARYCHPDLSGQSFEIKPDTTNTCQIRLE